MPAVNILRRALETEKVAHIVAIRPYSALLRLEEDAAASSASVVIVEPASAICSTARLLRFGEEEIVRISGRTW